MKRFFTIIELLAVIGILALLAGVLLPVVNNSMRQARKTQCAGSLKQIGIQMNTYVLGNDGRFPMAKRIGDGPDDPYSIPNIIGLEQRDVFHCPSDSRESYEGKTYFGLYGTSYEWDSWFNLKKIEDVRFEFQSMKLLTPLMLDAEDFHGDLGKNYLYSDGRVTRKLEDPVE